MTQQLFSFMVLFAKGYNFKLFTSKILKSELVHFVDLGQNETELGKVTCSKNKLSILKQKFTALKTNYLF